MRGQKSKCQNHADRRKNERTQDKITPMSLRTPLRYPGGKRKLANFVEALICHNKLSGCDYAEPYAGGAGLAVELLRRGVVSQLWLNDIDKGIASFWELVLKQPDLLCEMIDRTDVTIEEWKKQKELVKSEDAVRRGFATFFLNRTNRSGIIKGGVIGGKNQSGTWKLNCRFNKSELIDRIQAIAKFKDRIHCFNMDALEFLDSAIPKHLKTVLFNLDPPYYVKGSGLYTNFYDDSDHLKVSSFIRSEYRPWIVSYDNHDFIRKIYSGCEFIEYDLTYTAQLKTVGKEIMFFGNLKEIPEFGR